jgi:Ca2+-binding RTX toxin-like protein
MTRMDWRSLGFGLALVLVVAFGLGAGTALAKTTDCRYATACSGTGGKDTLRGVGQNNIFGKGGNDKLFSFGGASVVEGGPGDDFIRAYRPSSGPLGSNILDGGDGDDTIEAEAGGNDIRGGNGKDKIAAKNGAADTIDCGPNKDSAKVDAGLDDVLNCEKVS